jgi:hypothetical protein
MKVVRGSAIFHKVKNAPLEDGSEAMSLHQAFSAGQRQAPGFDTVVSRVRIILGCRDKALGLELPKNLAQEGELQV